MVVFAGQNTTQKCAQRCVLLALVCVQFGALVRLIESAGASVVFLATVEDLKSRVQLQRVS